MWLMSNRKIAYILTVLSYREVDCWEVRHSQRKPLNMGVYEEMYIAVKNNLDLYLPFLKYLRLSKDEWLELEKNLTQKEQDYMLGFAYYSRSISEWQPAVKLNEPIGDDIALYMLNGRFKAACENNELLDNDLMMEINIDVHNRTYTLIENGII